MGTKKIIVKEVRNGWVVKVLNSGLSPLREPYEQGEFVFESPDNFVEWMDKFFDIPGKIKQAEENK